MEIKKDSIKITIELSENEACVLCDFLGELNLKTIKELMNNDEDSYTSVDSLTGRLYRRLRNLVR